MTDSLDEIVECVTVRPRSDGDPTVWRQYNWGFTIYRTAYGGNTEASWNTLLKSIRDYIHYLTDHENLRSWGYDPVENSGKDKRSRKICAVWEAAPKARELFRLDPRSDQALLENVSPDRLRELFKEGAPGLDEKPPVMHDMGTMEQRGVEDEVFGTPGWRDNLGPFADRMFLVADAEVLGAVAAAPIDQDKYELWVKLFAVDIGLIPEDERRDEAYCGWTKLTVDMLVHVWGCVTMRTLDEVLPRSAEEGRDLGVWANP